MATRSVEFGYLPFACDLSVDDLSIATLPNLDAKMHDVGQEPSVHDRWLYAPLQQRRIFGTGEVQTLPYPSRIFGLPKTHVLTYKRRTKQEHLEFLVWCLGFFTGYRLTVAEAGFLDSTPIGPGKLTDFILGQRDIAAALPLADAFWKQHRKAPERAKMVGAIVHVLFLSQNPRHLPFEEFMYLYTALDGCYALLASMLNLDPKKRPSHARRIEWMCKHFRIRVPRWAKARGKHSRISIVRNTSFHEALFFDQPLGFSIFKARRPQGAGDVLLEMQALVCRLLVALLGAPKSKYVKSAVNTRQMHGLDL